MKSFGGPPGCVSFIPLDIPIFLLPVAVNCTELLCSGRLVTVRCLLANVYIADAVQGIVLQVSLLSLSLFYLCTNFRRP